MPITTDLINALIDASRVHPNQRVGQLITNAVIAYANHENHEIIDLFYVSDDDLTRALHAYANSRNE